MSQIERFDSIPEKAELTDECQMGNNPNHDEQLLFFLKDRIHEFTISVTDLLSCLKFAEEKGEIPELPVEWWSLVMNRYHGIPQEWYV